MTVGQRLIQTKNVDKQSINTENIVVVRGGRLKKVNGCDDGIQVVSDPGNLSIDKQLRALIIEILCCCRKGKSMDTRAYHHS